MLETSRQMMKGALCTLLNTMMASRGIRNVRAVDLSDDFDSVFLQGADGTKGVVHVDVIFNMEVRREEGNKFVDQVVARSRSSVA